jgi:hypothetical protein
MNVFPWTCALFILAICGEGKLLGPIPSSANFHSLGVRDPIIPPEDFGTFMPSPYGGQCKVPDSKDLFCGQCIIGCDGAVGSGLTTDKCGVCGGFGNTCCDISCVVAISVTSSVAILIGISVGLCFWWALVSGQEENILSPTRSLGSVSQGGFINARAPNALARPSRRTARDLRRRIHTEQ